ncbi:MAG: response regulator [Clostridiales bacterium]|nr:response regulator [Clostridiales bacterium]
MRKPASGRVARNSESLLKIHLSLDQGEFTQMVQRIRQELSDHRSAISQIKEKMMRLMTGAFEEAAKIKELENILENLKNNGAKKNIAALEDLKEEAGKAMTESEVEKLLVIKRLLETPASPARQESLPAIEPESPREAKKILVVDDDPTTVKIINHFLAKENYAVITSLSGLEGLKKALEESPDLILLDIFMPDLNGFQFLSIFRKNKENARVPIIILSSLSEEADVLKGLKTGAEDFIIKPFSLQVLLAKIKKTLDSSK